MKTGLALGLWVQTYHDPQRPSHGWQSSTFGEGTQDVFGNVSRGQSCAAGVDPAALGPRPLVSRDHGSHAGQSDDDPGGEKGLGSRRRSLRLGNRGAVFRRGLVVDRGSPLALAQNAAGLRLLSDPLVVRVVGSAALGAGADSYQPGNRAPWHAANGV